MGKQPRDCVLICQSCGNRFTFTIGEQKFYAKKGFRNAPTHCCTCRKRRRGEDFPVPYEEEGIQFPMLYMQDDEEDLYP